MLDFVVSALAGPTRERYGRALALFGQFAFEQGWALGTFKAAILAVIDRERHLQRLLAGAWDVAFSWRARTPARNHLAMPDSIFKAMVAVSLLWGWHDMAAGLMLGFLGCDCFTSTFRENVFKDCKTTKYTRMMHDMFKDRKNTKYNLMVYVSVAATRCRYKVNKFIEYVQYTPHLRIGVRGV